MKRLFLFGLFFLIISSGFLAAQSQPARAWSARDPSDANVGETPVAIVEEGVSSFTLDWPRITWNSSPPCVPTPTMPNAPADEDGPEVITRMAAYRGEPRQLLYVPPVPGECTPYEILSNVAADDEHVYWVDHSGLVRLPHSANVGDEPELVNADVVASASFVEKAEITDAGDDVFVSVFNGSSAYTLWQVKKSDFSADDVVTRNGAIYNLSYDEQYVYWINGGRLYRTQETATGFALIELEEGVTGYHAEGRREICRPTCRFTSFVFVGQGNRVNRYDNESGTWSTGIYESEGSEQNLAVYDMVTDATDLFILERRPQSALPPIHQHLLLRTTRGGGDADVLYQKQLDDQHSLEYLTTDGNSLYWKGYFQDNYDEPKLYKLPNDAEALPLINLSIERVEVTQGIQSTSNSIFLISGRRTVVRVLTKLEGTSVEIVTAHVSRLDSDGNVIDDPLSPGNKIGSTLVIDDEFNAESVEDNFLFEIPTSWTATSPLRLRVELNPYNDPLEPAADREDNVQELTLDVSPSPRMEVDFYVMTYEVNGVAYMPRMEEDVEQTFSWLRRAYPLASGPGYGSDPSPGLRPNVIEVNMGASLGARVTQTHPDCYLLNEDDRSLCASTFLNSWLTAQRLIKQSNNVFYGLMSDGAAFPRGRGRVLGFVASGPAGDASGEWAWDADGVYTDWYTGHEIGHALGRRHPLPGALECKQVPGDLNYPYPDAAIGPPDDSVWGFDVGDPAFDIDRAVLPSSIWRDVMSYCDYEWLSDYTYNGIYLVLLGLPQRPLTVAPIQDDLLGVYGVLFPETGMVTIHMLQHFDGGAAIPDLIPGDYSIRLVDGQGETLADYAFTPTEEGGDEQGTPIMSFGQIVDWVDGTANVQIVDLTTESIMAETAVSANAPQVDEVVLQNPPDPVTGDVTLAWEASDADGDELSFDVHYSRDGGASFQPVAVGLTANSTTVDSDKLGGGTGVFRLIASDGVHTDEADSPPYEVANKPPQPRISSPGDGDVYQWGQPVQLIGTAFDLQDAGVEEAELTWRLGDNRFPLGHGSMLTVDDLPVGELEIRLIATNSDGLSASTSVTIFVHDDLAFPGPTMDVAPAQVGWHVEPGATAAQTAELFIANSGTGALSWTAAENADWLTLDAAAGDAPSTLTVTADPTHAAEGERLAAEITLVGYDENDNETGTITVPVTLAAGNVWFGDELQSETVFLPLLARP